MQTGEERFEQSLVLGLGAAAIGVLSAFGHAIVRLHQMNDADRERLIRSLPDNDAGAGIRKRKGQYSVTPPSNGGVPLLQH